jgi:lipopolysaccharide/colanic/teichoic acid biosynthesis glycosyltransferase
MSSPVPETSSEVEVPPGCPAALRGWSCFCGRLRELGKRSFDLLIALSALVLLAPVFLLIALAIKLDSPGPVFFRQTRVGRHGRRFRMWKFRKMYETLARPGPSLTRRHDSRLTPVGRFLERTKLDELPQLFNVVLGHMSLVGPRPEVPKFVAHYPARWAEVLAVKPGVFGANQLRHRNESELYPPACEDLEAFYVRDILPDKLAVDAAYARAPALLRDVWILARCLLATVLGAVTWQTLVGRRWQIANVVILSLLGVGGMVAANALAGGRLDTDLARCSIYLAVLVKPLCLVAFRVPKALATSATADDFLRNWWCAVTSAALIVSGMVFADHRDVGRVILLLDTMFFLAVLMMYKLLLYNIYLSFFLQKSRRLCRRLVVASLAAAPLSMAVVVGFRQRPGAWSGPQLRLYLPVVLLAALIRPVVVLFLPVFPRRTVAAWFLSEWRKLAGGALVGSALLIFAALLVNERGLGRGDVLGDGALYLGLITGVAVWQHLRPRKSRSTGRRRVVPEPGAVERLLVVGSGVELSAYLTALSALPENRFQIVGVVTPYRQDRTNMVSGYPVLGQTLDIPELLSALPVTKVVVVRPVAGGSDAVAPLERLRTTGQAEIIHVNLLSPFG